MTQTTAVGQSTVVFIENTGFDNYYAHRKIHTAFGDLNETLLESVRAAYKKALKNGAEIEHTGILGPQGSREIIEWEPDTYLDGQWVRYSEWHKDGNRVRGTLVHKLTQNGEVTIVSSKKTFRVDD
jgi:hypothetical protein